MIGRLQGRAWNEARHMYWTHAAGVPGSFTGTPRVALHFGGLCLLVVMMGCALGVRVKELVPYRDAPSQIHRLYVVMDHHTISVTYGDNASLADGGRLFEAALKREREFSDLLGKGITERFVTEGLEVRVHSNSRERLPSILDLELGAAFARAQREDVATFSPDATLFLTLTRMVHWDNSQIYEVEYDVRLQATPADRLLWRATVRTPTSTQRKKWQRECFAKLAVGIVEAIKRANVFSEQPQALPHRDGNKSP